MSFSKQITLTSYSWWKCCRLIGNDIVPSDVYAELGNYNNYAVGVNSFPRPIEGRIAIRDRFIFPPGGSRGGWEDFDVSKV